MNQSENAKDSTMEQNQPASPPPWQPLTRLQRRVAGVLVEKAKTTPSGYPMSLNGVKTGCNQKSNRMPMMTLEEHQVENVLIELRGLGAVIERHGGGRVPKFKHELYDWLGVEKAELAVMAELLLRGQQTLGELRARAARMEKSITGMEQLRPILNSLKAKNLIVELTPAGRGQVITHNLYQPEELEQLKAEFGTQGATPPQTPVASRPEENANVSSSPTAAPETSERPNVAGTTAAEDSMPEAAAEIKTAFEQRIIALESSVSALAKEIADLKAMLE